MKKLLAVVLLSIAVATPALADSPFYAGALAGDQYLGVLGGYQINQMYSVEAHAAKVLHPTIYTPSGTIKTDNYGVGADLVVVLPWKVQKVPALSFFGKGGLEYVHDKVTTTVNGVGSSSVTTNELKLNLGGGAQYEVTKNFSARAGFGVMGARNELYVAAIFRF